LQSPRPQLTASERTIVLNSIDGLIRLKINLGLVKGLRHAC
jgi:hypothetical protein